MRAGWWAYRNPVIVTEIGFDALSSWLPGTPATSVTGYTIGLITSTEWGSRNLGYQNFFK